ncbi:MAG: YbjQ family protein [Fusobacteriota bacterium]
MEFWIFIALMAVGYSIGTITEKRHYKDIAKRERIFLNIPAVTMKNIIDEDDDIQEVKFVKGSVVISLDYFKKFIAMLKNIVGGRVITYESLLDRARREAILRMKEEAGDVDMILNVRLETTNISKTKRKKSMGSVEAIAYGTAIKVVKNEV